MLIIEEHDNQNTYETKADTEMPLVDHLSELRSRLLKAILAVIVGSTAVYFYVGELINYIAAPAGKLYYMNPAEAFFTYLKVSLFAGFILASPIVLYQAWEFIVPALRAKERMIALMLVPASVVLFVGGVLFAYFLVLPPALSFFMGFTTDNIQPLFSLGQYLSFIISFLLPFGFVFELPLFILVLAKIGLINAAFLARKRKLVIVLAFIVGAVVSPTPDVFSQTMIAIPVLILYEGSILVVKYVLKR